MINFLFKHDFSMMLKYNRNKRFGFVAFLSFIRLLNIAQIQARMVFKNSDKNLVIR